MAQPPKPKGRIGIAHVIAWGGLAFFIYSFVTAEGEERQSSPPASSAPASSVRLTTTTQAPSSAPVRLSDAERIQAASPATQRAFLSAVVNSRQAYNAAPNDMLKGATRPARAQALCAALPSGAADGWVGKITRLSSNNEGKGVLAIDIGYDVELKTWNNSLSDAGDNTLIATSSPLFSAVSTMRVGQLVRLSASLVRERNDCFREGSMTVSGAMTEPEFLARFSRVEPL